jgi:hypothetical protein
MTDPERLLADFEARLAETTSMAEQVRAGLDATSATARSGDGKVAVTVNATGNVVDLRLPDPDLAATVLATIRRAQSQLADAVHTAMPKELAGTAVLAELDTQYRTSYPTPGPTRTTRQHLRLGAEDEEAPERPAPRRPRPAPDGEEPEYGDRSLLR